jgi:hypothetical protein
MRGESSVELQDQWVDHLTRCARQRDDQTHIIGFGSTPDYEAASYLNNRPSGMVTGFVHQVVSLPPARHMNLFSVRPIGRRPAR